MTCYTEFQCLKRDKDVSTKTLLVIAKWFSYAIDRTDWTLYYRLVENVCAVFNVYCLLYWSRGFQSSLGAGRFASVRCVFVLLRVHRGLEMG